MTQSGEWAATSQTTQTQTTQPLAAKTLADTQLAATTKALFNQRTCILATMHRKEQAIAPLLEPSLGIQIRVPLAFNTDQFGTFTREVKRPGSQVEAARLKADQALQLTGESLAIASEGSFGPHPAMPYLPCNREIVVLVDRKHNLELIGQALSTETNHSHQQISSLEEAKVFAQKAGFPSHGLVVIADPKNNVTPVDASHIVKGITTEEQLIDAVTWALKQAKVAYLETDMRALYNPTRMKVIQQATRDLLRKLHQTCDRCGTPGFDVVDRRPGLPCGWCSLPTALTRSVIYQCQKCGFDQEILFPDGVETADPGQCAYCNP